MDEPHQIAERIFLDWLDGLSESDQVDVQNMPTASKSNLIERIAEGIRAETVRAIQSIQSAAHIA